MLQDDRQDQFKRILEYGIHRGNDANITAQQLIKELTDQLKEMFENQLEYK